MTPQDTPTPLTDAPCPFDCNEELQVDDWTNSVRCPLHTQWLLRRIWNRRSLERKLQAAARSLAAAQAALRELVELKDLHERTNQAVSACAVDSHALLREYQQRKPKAWEAARKALAPQEGER